jgi:hypothetical protein
VSDLIKAPVTPSGQASTPAQPSQAVGATSSGSPFFEYEWEEGNSAGKPPGKEVFKNKEELAKRFREGTLFHAGFYKKSEELAKHRKELDAERKQMEATAAQIRHMEAQHKPVDSFLKSRPDVYNYILSQMRSPSQDTVAKQAEGLVTEKTKAIEEKLKKFEDWQQEQDLERQRQSIFGQFKKEHEDFDEDAIKQELQRANEVPEEDSLRSLVEMIYYARKGRETPAQIEQRIVESGAVKAQKKPPVPPGRAVKEGSATTPKSFKEAAEMYKKKHAAG